MKNQSNFPLSSCKPTVYNLGVQDDFFSESEVKALYKTYFYANVIPVRGRLQLENEGKNIYRPADKETMAMIYISLICDGMYIDADKLLDKVERYSKWKEWTQLLLKSIPSCLNEG